MNASQPQQFNLPAPKGVRNSLVIRALNKFFASPFGLFLFAALTLVCFIFSWELHLYATVIIYALYLCIFGEDFMTLIPLFLFCYVSASPKNNPGKAESSIFYGAGGIIILAFAAIAVFAIFIRIATDENMGFKRLFTQKRALLGGFLVLGLSYMMSGIGSDHYAEIYQKNLFFAALQFLSIFLLYFIFSATIDWKKRDKSYLAWAMVMFGLLVCGELISVYFTNGVVSSGMIERQKIYTGWGMYNNVGAMIAVCVPFAFYLCTRYKVGPIFVSIALFFVAMTFFSCSRGSCIGAAIGFVLGFIVAAIKAPDKIAYLLGATMLISITIILAVLVGNKLITLFTKVPDIMLERPQGFESILDFFKNFNDSNRFEIYLEGLKVYIRNPIFGDSFYPSDYAPWDFSELEQFSSFFPPRWHNTFIQLMACCGTFGLFAYLYHRFQTLRLFFKNPSTTKTFIGISLLVFLAMCMLDCHLFNLGPAFVYSICLMFAENIPNEKPALPLQRKFR